MPFVDPNFYKDKFEVEGKMVMLTFGLLSPSKGIASVIEALPAILATNPNVVYLVVGATHPHVLRNEGESYRLEVERLAHERGVESNVVFHNRFVSYQELVEFLGAADIYITPYINEAQITSGTLAYAVGTGKATISTPYWYAQELLDDGCGVLVPFNDPAAIADEVVRLLDDEPARHAMRKRAYMRGRDMIWPEVARRYARSFEQALARHKRPVAPEGIFVTMSKRPRELPPMKLDHLRRLTDDTGIIQHAVFAVPDFSKGYTTDDNARALILAVLLEEAEDEVSSVAADLASRYMAFLWYAFDPVSGRFRNLLSYERGMERRGPLRRQPRPGAVGAGHRAGPLSERGPARAGGEISSNARCAPRWTRPPHARGPSLCWRSTSTCGDSPETAASSWPARRLPTGCWTSTAGPAPRSGSGSRRWSATTTASCRTPSCSAAAG